MAISNWSGSVTWSGWSIGSLSNSSTRIVARAAFMPDRKREGCRTGCGYNASPRSMTSLNCAISWRSASKTCSPAPARRAIAWPIEPDPITTVTFFIALHCIPFNHGSFLRCSMIRSASSRAAPYPREAAAPVRRGVGICTAFGKARRKGALLMV